jgi:hypothetical protein
MRFMSSRVVIPVLFFAFVFATAARAQTAPPATETQEQVFAKGLSFFIASASLGDPAGTINEGQPIKGRLHFVRRPGTTGDRVAVEFAFSVLGRSGSMYTRTSSTSYAYPTLSRDANEGDLTFEFSWTEPLGEAGEVSGTLRMTARPVAKAVGPLAVLSNAIPVKVRVLKSSQATAPVVIGTPLDAGDFTIDSVKTVRLEKTLQREYFTDPSRKGENVAPPAEQIFIVVDATVAFKRVDSKVKADDLVLRGTGGSVFRMVGFLYNGFLMGNFPTDHGVTLGLTEEHYKKQKGVSEEVLIFMGPERDATGQLTLATNRE